MLKYQSRICCRHNGRHVRDGDAKKEPLAAWGRDLAVGFWTVDCPMSIAVLLLARSRPYQLRFLHLEHLHVSHEQSL